MADPIVERLERDPRYHALVRERSRFAWTLAIVMFAAFLGYIGLIAFDKAALAAPIGDGVTSLGIPAGIGLILFAILLTGLYVVRANRVYDPRMAEILAANAE
jgi:uncharacterized membrane protein (DUF485 family)